MTERRESYETEQPDRLPTFALIQVPDGWPTGGTLEKMLVVLVRDNIPNRGIVVDALPAHRFFVAHSIRDIYDRLKEFEPKPRKRESND